MAEHRILDGRQVSDGERGGEGALAVEVGLGVGGSAIAVLPVRKMTASMAMIDDKGDGWCFTLSMSLSVPGRREDGDGKAVTASKSRDRAPQSILEPSLRIIVEGGREDSGDDGNGAGNSWRGFPLRDEDGDGEESTSGRHRAMSREEITGGRRR